MENPPISLPIRGKTGCFFFAVQLAVAIALRIRSCALIPEFPANALVFGDSLCAARADY